MSGGQLALVLIGGMVGGVIAVGLITQHILKRRPSSGALKPVPADETVFRVLAVVVFFGWITLLRAAPAEGKIAAFLDAWYGWPAAIALGVFGIYIVTVAFTFLRLALKRRDHGA